MDSYIEIRILPDQEFEATTLMSTVFAKLHRALVESGRSDIGVSFPEAGKTPGALLRLHGSLAALESIMTLSWLTGLQDYTQTSGILQVPAQAAYVQVARVQSKMTASRIRRALKRGSLSEERALELLQSRDQLNQPFFVC